jgi:hypothetical protein
MLTKPKSYGPKILANIIPTPKPANCLTILPEKSQLNDLINSLELLKSTIFTQ